MQPGMKQPIAGPESPKPKTVIVNDNETQKAMAATVKENQQLRAANVSLTQKLNETAKQLAAASSVPADEQDWKARAQKAEQMMEAFEDKDFTAIIENRKMAIFKAVLQGAASNGQLFGKGVGKDQLDQALRHFVGVAVLAERKARNAGF